MYSLIDNHNLDCGLVTCACNKKQVHRQILPDIGRIYNIHVPCCTQMQLS